MPWRGGSGPWYLAPEPHLPLVQKASKETLGLSGSLLFLLPTFRTPSLGPRGRSGQGPWLQNGWHLSADLSVTTGGPQQPSGPSAASPGAQRTRLAPGHWVQSPSKAPSLLEAEMIILGPQAVKVCSVEWSGDQGCGVEAGVWNGALVPASHPLTPPQGCIPVSHSTPPLS